MCQSVHSMQWQMTDVSHPANAITIVIWLRLYTAYYESE